MSTVYNTRRIVVLSILVTLLELFGPYQSFAAKPETSGPPEVPASSRRFNMTDFVPHAFIHNYTSGSPHVFQFRNMTIMVNANRRMVLNITAEPEFQMSRLELQLNLRRSLALNVQARVGPPEGVPKPEDGIHKYLEIEPNSTAGVRATLRLYIDHEELGRHVEPQRLRWCFWNGTDWEPVTSWMDREGFLVCNTTHFSAWTIREMKQPPTIPAPDIPGIPAQVRAYNYTMVTPDRFMWTVREREQAVFAFREMTMTFNCSKNLELNITSSPQIAQRLFMLELRPGEALRLNMDIQVEPHTQVQATDRSMGVYCEIESNATTPVNARLGMLIEEEALEARLGREIDTMKLKWAWWDGTDWEEVESTLTEDNVLETETDHFSTWTIVEAESEEPVEPEEEPNNLKLYAGLAILAIITAFILFQKKNA
jgi:hypothetical protein